MEALLLGTLSCLVIRFRFFGVDQLFSWFVFWLGGQIVE